MKYNQRFCLLCGILFLAFMSISYTSCSHSNKSEPEPPVTPPDPPVVATIDGIEMWLTKSDQSVLLKQQTSFLQTLNTSAPVITVDSSQTFQSIDGFGYTLTGGSAYVINHGLDAASHATLLQDLFSTTGITISYLRLSMGASDLDASVFSYDDLPAGQTDVNLEHFSLQKDETELIPLLKEILVINPNIKIIATPWSPPVWMKDNASSIGGQLKPEYYATYSNYFIKYVNAMKAQGITITAITPQNEPQNPNNNPSLSMSAEQQLAFIKTNMGPAFKTAGLTTKIITWDHNADMPNYPLTVLADADANTFVDGSAFHLYAGDVSALGTVHDAYPTKNIYFTEQYTATTGQFAGDLKWHLKNVIIGTMRNWSRTALEWNLANDASFGPHTDGGCTTCKGALTIASGVFKNVAYYIIGHASKFVTPGSVRIGSNLISGLNNVAFKRPDGKKVLIVENDNDATTAFTIAFGGKKAAVSLSGGGVATFVW